MSPRPPVAPDPDPGLLPCVEIETGPEPNAAIIWLHGLGADGHDFVPIVPALALPSGTVARFIFPHAPEMPVTVNVGHVMPAWFDILSFDFDAEVDLAGLQRSRDAVEALIAREARRGIPSSRIVLAGFSQGGVVAGYTAIRHAAKLAGAALLSTYLPLRDGLRDEASPANRDLPIFIAHGRQDDLISIDDARAARDALRLAGFPVEWRDYAMPHSTCPAEVDDLSAWFRRIL